MKKNILIKLGLLSSTMLPLSMVVACGPTVTENDFDINTKDSIANQLSAEKKFTESNASIKIAVKEVDKYKAIIEKFNSFGKGQVSIQELAENPSQVYDGWFAAGSQPEIILSDLNVVQRIRNSGSWAEPTIFDEWIGDANSDLYNVFENQTSFEVSDFNSGHLDLFQNQHDVNYGIPNGFGSRGLIVNNLMIDNDPTTTKIDVDYKIRNYVPVMQNDVDETDLFQKHYGIKALKNGDDYIETHVQSIEDIQNYLWKAGDKSEQSVENWYGYGPGNMFQRIFSLGFSIMTNNDATKSMGASVMALKENLINFGLLATSGQTATNETNVMTQELFEQNLADDENCNDTLAKYYYDSVTGYMLMGNQLGFVTSDYINKSANQGEVEPLQYGQSMFSLNPEWALRMASSNIKTTLVDDSRQSYRHAGITPTVIKNLPDDYEILNVLSAPYDDISTADAFSITKGITDEKRLIAKRFLKYINATDDNDATKIQFKLEGKDREEWTVGELADSNYISSNKKINKLQQSSGTKNPSWFLAGNKSTTETSDIYDKISGTVWKMTDGSYIRTFEGQWISALQEFQGTEGSKNKTKWTYEEFKKAADKGFKGYFTQMGIA